MQKNFFEKILSFLLGASWAFIALGAVITFKFFLFFGLASAVFTTFLYIIFSMFFILLLDYFKTSKDILKEKKEQTKLLREISSKLLKTSKD